MSKILRAKVPLVIAILVAALISGLVSTAVWEIAVNSQSLQGAKGATGATGRTGAQGLRGETGAIGATGATGQTGATGPQGPKGDAGADGVNGVNGSNGATWLTGTGVPNSSLGVNNDFYFDTNNSDVYNKISGVWAKITNIQGAIGANGVKGDTGLTGPQGPPGATVNSYANIGAVGNLDFTGDNIGSVTITAPANGVAHVTLTGYVQMYNNNSCLFGIGSNPTLTDLDLVVVGVSNAGSTSQQAMYSMISQAEVPVTAGNTYAFYATAFRWEFNDAAAMTLNSVKMTAEFSEK
jgi:hypothetical protein